MIDLNFENRLDPQKGRVLISYPFLEDDFFTRSVILLCEHNPKGSFGFVLNHYVDAQVHEMIQGFPEIDFKVSIGGPVSTSNIYYIHDLGEQITGSIPVSQDVYMGGDFDEIRTMIINGEATEDNVRFFIGYSGWSANQLEQELEEQSWIVSDTSYKEVMNTDIEKLWKHTMQRQGHKFKIMSDFPKDYRLN